jgi:hypothetical protein
MSYHHHTITPFCAGQELLEHREVVCGPESLLFQRIERLAHKLEPNYPAPLLAFQIDCRECKATFYFADGEMYDEFNRPVTTMEMNPQLN